MKRMTKLDNGRYVLTPAENEEEGSDGSKVVSEKELKERLKKRSDIFTPWPTRNFILLIIGCIVVACIVGIRLRTLEITDVATDFYEPHPEEHMGRVVSESAAVRAPTKSVSPPAMTERKTMRPEAGDPRARVTEEGVLGVVSGEVRGRQVTSADVFGRGGSASEIDALVQGMGGLRKSGRVQGIGFGQGYGSGFGGGSGGVDDLMDNVSDKKKSETAKINSKISEPVRTWKRSAITANTSQLSVGVHDSLPLKGVQMTVQIDGIRARVVMDCFYENTFDRQLEGTFKLRLPHEASPYYFAFGETVLIDKENGRIPFAVRDTAPVRLTPQDIRYRRSSSWDNIREARIVPRERATYAYTETARRRVDPALMEWAGADIFNCRVFPLMPHRLHRIVIGYDVDLQAVGDDRVLSLQIPSAKCPVCIDLDMAKLDGCIPVVTPAKKLFEYDNHQSCRFDNPSGGEITVRYPRPGTIAVNGADNDGHDYWAAAVKVALPENGSVASSENAVFLVDVSLSGNPDRFNIWLALMDAILSNNEDCIKKFGVLFFNVETNRWKENAVVNNAENRSALQAYASSLVLEGATDIRQALAAVRNITFEGAGDERTVFLLSDGAVTWGENDAACIAREIHSGDRLYGYLTGMAGTDTRLLEQLARAGSGALFTVAGESEIRSASRAFRTQSWRLAAISVDGCTDVIVKGRPEDVFNGQYLTVAGRGVVPEYGEIKLSLQRGGKTERVTIPVTRRVESALASRMYGQIATGLLEEGGASVEKYATSYALHFTVPGQTCALLMLETERDYRRYGIIPQNDALAVASFKVCGFLDELTSRQDMLAQNGKEAFVAWLHKLETLPDIGFSVGMALDIAVKTIPASAFNVTPPVLQCRVRNRNQLSKKYLTALAGGQVGYAAVIAETDRRRKDAGAHDAVKTLSSLVECNPGNSEILRDVGYGVMELGLDGHAYHLFRQVAFARPFEPQTYCALGEALTRMNNADLAVIYYEIALSAQWNPRYGDFRKIATLDYLHLLRAVEKNRYKVHCTDFVSERIKSLEARVEEPSADLMVAITWNTDNTDIDLHVLEPSGEECFYQNTETKIGGSITSDVTTGYGPEMYVLRNAPHGTYAISVNNFADHGNRTGVITTVYTTIYRNWGKPGEKIVRKKVLLEKAKENNLLADITI